MSSAGQAAAAAADGGKQQRQQQLVPAQGSGLLPAPGADELVSRDARHGQQGCRQGRAGAVSCRPAVASPPAALHCLHCATPPQFLGPRLSGCTAKPHPPPPPHSVCSSRALRPETLSGAVTADPCNRGAPMRRRRLSRWGCLGRPSWLCLPCSSLRAELLLSASCEHATLQTWTAAVQQHDEGSGSLLLSRQSAWCAWHLCLPGRPLLRRLCRNSLMAPPQERLAAKSAAAPASAD